MQPDIEHRKLAVEIISTLVYIKTTMVDLVLRPAGVPMEIYKGLLYERDDATGRVLSKRQIAPLILEAAAQRGIEETVLRALIELTAGWTSFHLANDEFQARATVQKAHEVLGQLEIAEEREARQRELARKEELARLECERAELRSKHSSLLLMMFDSLSTSSDHQQRGYLLQDLLNRLFDIYELPVTRSFVRNDGGEQIDGAFKLEGWHHIVECRWRQKLADIRELDGLKGQVARSGKQTMGLFLSVNGWSDHVPGLLKQSPQKDVILMDGYDLRCVLAMHADLVELLLGKLTALNIDAEPFLGVKEFLERNE